MRTCALAMEEVLARLVGDRSCHIATNSVGARDGAGAAARAVQRGSEPPRAFARRGGQRVKAAAARTSSSLSGRVRVVPGRPSGILDGRAERGQYLRRGGACRRARGGALRDEPQTPFSER